MALARVAAIVVAVVMFCSPALGATPCDLQPSGTCRCNVSYCDTVAAPEHPLPAGAFQVYETSKIGARLTSRLGQLGQPDRSSSAKEFVIKFILDPAVRYQSIIGFGGAFTDAATINMASCGIDLRTKMLEAYFGPSGLDYSLGRVNMGGCDFSTRVYTYDDVKNDLNLSHFALADEDVNFKIPAILDACQLAGRNITLFGSPWSSPGWMKTTEAAWCGGTLADSPQIHSSWARYFSRFITEYEARGVHVWGVTAQNEPKDGLLGKRFPFNSLGFTAVSQADFIEQYLGPELSASHPDVVIMALDDQRINLPDWPDVIFSRGSAKYVQGTAVHWYLDSLTSPERLNETHHRHPSKFLLGTEACTGEIPPFNGPKPGDWRRGEHYAKDIIGDLENWITGWTDWNLALNMTGGPNWANNVVDAAILVDKDNSQFFKNPMYYTFGHFAKFLRPGTQRISKTVQGISDDKDLYTTAFVDEANGRIVFTILNAGDGPQSFEVNVAGNSSAQVAETVAGHTLRTYLLPLA